MFTSIEKECFLLVSDLLWHWYCMSMNSFLFQHVFLTRWKKNAVSLKLCQKYIKYLYEDCDVMFKRCSVTNAVINISFFDFVRFCVLLCVANIIYVCTSAVSVSKSLPKTGNWGSNCLCQTWWEVYRVLVSSIKGQQVNYLRWQAITRVICDAVHITTRSVPESVFTFLGWVKND